MKAIRNMFKPKDAGVRYPKSDFYNVLQDSKLEYKELGISRMNWRYSHVILPVIEDIKEARILDLGSHDGRWPFAFANSGAREVIGIEGRRKIARGFRRFPPLNKDRVTMKIGDFVDEMDRMLAAKEEFDVVSCLGVFYHTMHHYRMLCQMTAFRPKLIIIDSEFSNSLEPVIRIGKERTASKRNSIAMVRGQREVPVGYPSIPAVQSMAQSLGYELTVVNWHVPRDDRKGVLDYFGSLKHRIRKTIHLRPMAVGSVAR